MVKTASANITHCTEDFSSLLDMMRDSDEGEGYTTREICAQTGHSEHKVRRMLADALRKGRVRVSKKHILDLGGRPQRVNSYVICGDQA